MVYLSHIFSVLAHAEIGFPQNLYDWEMCLYLLEPKPAHDFDLITGKTWGFVGENCIDVGDESSLMSQCVCAES